MAKSMAIMRPWRVSSHPKCTRSWRWAMPATGPAGDGTIDMTAFGSMLARARTRDMALICANPDRVVEHGDRLLYCGGALADLYEARGGMIRMAGNHAQRKKVLAAATAARAWRVISSIDTTGHNA